MIETVERATLGSAARKRLQERIASREATIGIVGLGYAGLPLAVAFAEAGFVVAGVDRSAERVAALSASCSYVGDVADERVAPLIANELLRPSVDYRTLAGADAITICVPTPLTDARAPDTSAIVDAINSLALCLRPGQLVVLESTSFPGTTDEIVRPVLEEQGFTVGRDVFLAFAPERVNPGDERYGTRNTPKLIGGVTDECRAVATALYETIVDEVVPVSSPVVAEMAKLLENTFRAINVGLANEMAIICERLGVDVWEVIDAAATKPFGFMPFQPGPGLGGPCIPIVPQYLAWKLKTMDYEARFIDLADEVNRAMPNHVAELIAGALSDEGKHVSGARVLVLGVAYKANVADIRESPGIAILERLYAQGADVTYNDPLVPRITVAGIALSSVVLDQRELDHADCVVIATDHQSYDWGWVVDCARLIVDTRNATSTVPAAWQTGGARIVKLGAPRNPIVHVP